MDQNIVTALSLSAAVLFILSIGGLSNQEKAKRAVWYGIIGMALAAAGLLHPVAAALIMLTSSFWVTARALSGHSRI